MPVQLETPVIIQAIPEKTFDEKFYRMFEVRCTPETGTLYFEFVPKSSNTGELLDMPTELRYNLWELAANIPEAALALQKTLEALPIIENYIKQKEEENTKKG